MVHNLRFFKSKPQIYLLTIFYIIQFILFINNSEYGLDFTDESFYLLNTLYAENNKFFVLFGYFLKPIFQFANENISLFRIYGLLLLNIAVIVFTISFKKYLLQEFKNININIYEFLFFNLNVALLYYFQGCNITPSYNLINLISVLFFASGLFYSISNNRIQILISNFLILITGVICFLTKPTTAVGLFLCFAIWFFAIIKNKKKYLHYLTGLTIILTIVSYFLLDNEFLLNQIDRFRETNLIQELYPLTSLTSSTFRVLRLIFELVYNYYLIFILILIIANEKYQIINNELFKIIIVICFLLTSYVFNYQKFLYTEISDSVNYTWIFLYNLFVCILVIYFAKTKFLLSFDKLIFFAPIFILILFYGGNNWKLHLLSIIPIIYSNLDLFKRYKINYLLVITFFILSFSFAFGTNNPYTKIMIECSIFISSLIYVLIKKLYNEKTVVGTLLTFIIIGISFQSVIFYRINPYRQLSLSSENVENTKISNYKPFKLKINKHDKNYITRIQKLAQKNGWNEKSRILDLTGSTPVINLILDSPFLGVAWYLGGYPECDERSNYIYKKVNLPKYTDLWVLSCNEKYSNTLRCINIESLEFPHNFEKIGSITLHRENKENHCLWKKLKYK